MAEAADALLEKKFNDRQRRRTVLRLPKTPSKAPQANRDIWSAA